MDANTIAGQSLLPVNHESAEKAFWCEPVSLVNKQEFPPTNDSPCQGDEDCSGCNGNPNCSHGCA